MVAYDPYNIATTLRFDRANRHLSVDFLQQASLILYKRDDIKNIDDKILVSEFGSKLFILVCTWRLLCDYGGLSEEESDPKYLLWWLYMVRNYPRTKTFARDVTLIDPRCSRKHIYPIKEAMLKIKRYVVSYISVYYIQPYSHIHLSVLTLFFIDCLEKLIKRR